MKNIIIIFIFFISVTLIKAQSIYLLDEKNGFKDLHFGDYKSEMMNKIFDCTPSGHCLIAGDSYRNINGIQLKNVFAKFSQGRLCVIIISVEGQHNVDMLLDLYKAAYGKATRVSQAPLEAMWSANNVMLDFTINVDNDGNVTALAIMASKALLKQYNDDDLLKSINDM